MKQGKPEPRLTQAERRARTQAELLDAAARLFARRGYHGASVEEIAAEAGLTKGAVYYNFDGKEGLFLALLDRHVEERIALLAELRDSGPNALAEGARRMSRSLRRDRDWGLLFFEFAAQAARDPAVRRRFDARMRRVHTALVETVGEIAPPGADRERLAGAAEAMIDGYAMRTLLAPRADVAAELATGLTLLWRGAAA
ncbi:MAG: hypothetical protein QOI91_1447 [Solirubrobacteraceae bacterium]|jgi:AcrR family transcriptional regulator|nr:hypothetical protein [Solirubrobacteraceae bacterium]